MKNNDNAFWNLKDTNVSKKNWFKKRKTKYTLLVNVCGGVLKHQLQTQRKMTWHCGLEDEMPTVLPPACRHRTLQFLTTMCDSDCPADAFQRVLKGCCKLRKLDKNFHGHAAQLFQKLVGSQDWGGPSMCLFGFCNGKDEELSLSIVVTNSKPALGLLYIFLSSGNENAWQIALPE
jgi:hypothetical protein